MFFSPKPTIGEDDLAWQLECWHWLLDHFGGVQTLKKLPTILPTSKEFPQSGKSGKNHAEHVFRQVVKYFGLDYRSFSIKEQEAEVNPILGPLAVIKNAPVSPLGTYSGEDSENHVITYSPINLKNLEILIATFAHEICHSLLLNVPSPSPGGPEAEEFATDLAVAFFGFGIFGGNGSFRFEQFTDPSTGTQGWSTSGAGYLSQNEWGFALATRAHLTGENTDHFEEYCTQGLFLNFRKNFKFLSNNNQYLSHLR